MDRRDDSTDYLYASARIRAIERTLPTRERLLQLADAASADDITAALADDGFLPAASRGDLPRTPAGREALLTAALTEGIAAVRTSVPDPALVAFLQYPYDCHNAKTLLKCALRGVDPAPLLIDAGTVPAEALRAAFESDAPTGLPRHMADALGAARALYARTSDPREIDLTLDRACFSDEIEAAAGCAFAAGLVRARADLLNLMICLRLCRMGENDAQRALLGRALVPGGRLPRGFFTDAFEGGENALCESLAHTDYAGLFTPGMPLSAAEKQADDRWMAEVKKARFVPFGPEVPIAYLAALETVIRNLRILLSGRAAGLDGPTLRARVRDC